MTASCVMYVLWVQVYDVYRPGSHVSRKRAVYPPVMYRLALCSGTPPTPQARDSYHPDTIAGT